MMESGESEPLVKRSTQEGELPKDRWYVVYMIFYLLGIGALLPFNFFSNARQYFVFKLRSNISVAEVDWVDDPDDYNHLQSMFIPYLTMAAMIPNVLFMFLNTAATKILLLRTRIIIAATAMIIMFALTVILTKINTDSWQGIFFALTMATIFIMNAGSAVLQGGVFGLSSMFPQEYTQAVMGGMGLGGVIAAVANIVAIPLSDGPSDTGFGYFLTAEIVVIGALIGYLCLPWFKFARHHITGRIRCSSHSISVNYDSNTDSSVEETAVQNTTHVPMWRVFKQMWVYAVSVFIVFLVTLSSFPAITSRIFSVHKQEAHSSDWVDKYYIPVTCFLLFNFGDLVGRMMAGFVQWPREKSPLLPLFCVLRIVFIPLFILCNILPRHHTSLVFHNDYSPILITSFFSLTNGYLGTLCMMYGPRVIDPDNIEIAGSMMSLFLSLGLAIGSAISFLLVSLI